MEKFYADRDADFEKWYAKFEESLSKGWLSPKEIFEHAYTLGALQNAKKNESN